MMYIDAKDGITFYQPTSSISWISFGYIWMVDNLVNMIDTPTLCGTFSALPSTLNILTYHR